MAIACNDITTIATALQDVFIPCYKVTANDMKSIMDLIIALDTCKEDDLGIPAVDGYMLVSTVAGVRSWVVNTGVSEKVALEVSQAAHGFDQDFVYYNDSTWVLALSDDADTTATHFAENLNTNLFNLISIGEVDTTGMLDDVSAALVIGDYYFLSQTVAGKVSVIKPASGIAQSVLIANELNNSTISIQEPYNASTAASNTSIKAIKAVTANYPITIADHTILMDGTSNTVTVTLLASPVHGSIVNIKSIVDTFATDINPNGKTIDASGSNLVVVAPNNIPLQYDTTYGWVIL